MNLLICGGAGYIGSHLAKLMAGHGHHITVFDNLSTGHSALARWGRLHTGDLLNPADLESVFSGGRYDAVMHFAARSIVGESVSRPDLYYRNNVAGTINLLEAMLRHRVRRLIFSSTAAVYGTPRYSPIDEAHDTCPINPYGISKRMIEMLLADYDRAFGLRSVALRYFNAAGADPEGETGEWHEPETHLIPRILQSLGERAADVLQVYGDDYQTVDGTCVRDYVHVQDLCEAHRLALDHLVRDGSSEVFNLGNGRGFSVLEVIRATETVTGCAVPYEVAPRRAGDPAVLVAASARAQRVLGWRPRHAHLEDIIATAWAWHRKRPSRRLRAAGATTRVEIHARNPT